MKTFIKRLLREEFEKIKETKPQEAVGVLVKSEKTGRLFLLLRNDNKPSWSIISGGLDEGEDRIEGLKREIKEELSINPDIIELTFIHTEKSSTKNMLFHYYQGLTYDEFSPILDNENLDWGWFSKDKLPSPLFPKMEEKIGKI